MFGCHQSFHNSFNKHHERYGRLKKRCSFDTGFSTHPYGVEGIVSRESQVPPAARRYPLSHENAFHLSFDYNSIWYFFLTICLRRKRAKKVQDQSSEKMIYKLKVEMYNNYIFYKSKYNFNYVRLRLVSFFLPLFMKYAFPTKNHYE